MSLYVAAVFEQSTEIKLDGSGKHYVVPVKNLIGYAVFDGTTMVSGIFSNLADAEADLAVRQEENKKDTHFSSP
ncbi:MAG: hypothetical protein OHK0048_25530 [Rhodoferax sp.]